MNKVWLLIIVAIVFVMTVAADIVNLPLCHIRPRPRPWPDTPQTLVRSAPEWVTNGHRLPR